MAMFTVRNIPEEVHRALRARAARHGRSTEAEVREILQAAVKPKGRMKLGSLLAEVGNQVGLTEEEKTVFDSVRDNSPAQVVDFDDPA